MLTINPDDLIVSPIDFDVSVIDDFVWPFCWNQTIHGTNGNDDLDGGCGNDTIYGNSGNDTINGHDGNDKIYAGFGNDYAYGDAGNDFISMSRGDDTAFGGDGNDTVYGGAGNDRIYDFDGVNTQNGGSGNDILYIYDDRAAGHYSIDSNKMYGGSGNDDFWLIGGSINAFGGTGSDEFNFYSGPQSAWHYAEGGSGTDHYHIRNVDESLFIQIDGFDAGETMTFHDGFAPWVSDLDSNNNGVLDSGDTYVEEYFGSTAIRNDDLYVLIWENGQLDADQFVIA